MFQSGTVLRHAFWTAVVSAWLSVDTSSASAAAAHTTKAACEADPGWTWLSSASPISRKTSAPSLVAASVMGAEGFSKVPPALPAMWESSLLTKCSDNSSAGNLWFDRCSPDGMVNTINREFRQNWHVNTYISDDWEQLNAIQYMISVLRYFGSPSVVPIYGRGDHFLTAESICVKFKPDGRTLSSFDVSTFHDAVISTDGAGNRTKESSSFSGREFRNDFYEILSNIGPGCPGPCPDPYYNKYILMNDPPEGAALLTSPVNRELEFVRFPGIVPTGEMTAARATQDVRRSLHEAGFLADPGVVSRLDQGMALPAYAVTMLGRKGARTESFIVPVRSDRGGVSLFVRMSGEDGAIEQIFTLDTPFTYQPVSSQQALTLGLPLIRSGERLGEGHLVWDATLSQPDVRHPHQPFFEFPVQDSVGRAMEGIWVAMHTGRVIGRGPLRVPSVRP